MTIKAPFLIKNEKDIPNIGRAHTKAFQVKLESIYHRTTTGIRTYLYQNEETGVVSYSATGSPTIALSFGFKEKQNTILYYEAHTDVLHLDAKVTDITSTGLTITVGVMYDTSTDVSAVITTNQFNVIYRIKGSNP